MATTPTANAYQLNTSSASGSKLRLWIGDIISALPALFFCFDGVMKLVKPVFVVEDTVKLETHAPAKLEDVPTV